MADIEILNNGDLENISGGATVGNCTFSGRVTPEECVVGRNYYYVHSGNWYYGTLTKIEVQRSTVSGKGKLFYFSLKRMNGSSTNQTLCADPYLGALYTSMA